MKKYPTRLVMYLGMALILTSCVQTDFDEYYDFDDPIENYIPRRKGSKDIYINTYNCGVCCTAYIMNGMKPNLGSTIGSVVQKCIDLDLPYGAGYSHSQEELEMLLEACTGESWTTLTWNAIVDGEEIPNYYADQMQTAFQSMGSYPMVVNTGYGHWIVGREYISQKTRWGRIMECTEVDCYDPQMGYGYGTIDIHDIPCIIYRE